MDLSRAAVDGSHLRALKGGDATEPSPVDRGKTGSKHHVIVDAHGILLAATVTAGKSAPTSTSFVTLGCAIICRRRLKEQC